MVVSGLTHTWTNAAKCIQTLFSPYNSAFIVTWHQCPSLNDPAMPSLDWLSLWRCSTQRVTFRETGRHRSHADKWIPSGIESKHERSRQGKELSDIGTTRPETCLPANSLQLFKIPALSGSVLSCSLSSPLLTISFSRHSDIKYPRSLKKKLPWFHTP